MKVKLFTMVLSFQLSLFNDFIQVVQNITTFLKDMTLINLTDIQMKLLPINVEKIAKEITIATFGLLLQTPAIWKVKRHWKTEEVRVMQFQQPINVQVLGTFHNKPSSHKWYTFVYFTSPSLLILKLTKSFKLKLTCSFIIIFWLEPRIWRTSGANPIKNFTAVIYTFP